MTDAGWLDGDAVRPLVAEVVAAVLRQYRADPAAAAAWVAEVLARDAALRAAAGQAATADQLRRTRAFRDAADAAKKHVYYALRRYRPAGGDDDALDRLRRCAPGPDLVAAARAVAAGHRSTAERLPCLDEFYARLFELVGTPATVLDVGCGVQPLLFPFDAAGGCVRRYVALDKDAAAVDAVAAYAQARGDGRVVAVRSDLGRGWADLPADAPPAFDVALLLKLVPVVERRERELVEVLAETPAARWVVTGSRVALAKQRSIERRERAALAGFVARAGRRVVAEFIAGEEFGWLVE